VTTIEVSATAPETEDVATTTRASGGRHLLSLGEIGLDAMREILHLTDRFVEVGERSIPRVPALRGKTVCSLFFEDSTRTRLSFETAAKRLSADTMSFSVGSSSVNKGESVRDTVETVQAMGIDAFVVRHPSAGVPWQITRWVEPHVSVINGGDGWHGHPTQGLLDAYTLLQARHGVAGPSASLDGQHIGIVGDVKHSRVARSDVEIFTALGAQVTLIAPPTLLPPNLESWPVQVTHDFDSVIGERLRFCHRRTRRGGVAAYPARAYERGAHPLDSRVRGRLRPDPGPAASRSRRRVYYPSWPDEPRRRGRGRRS